MMNQKRPEDMTDRGLLRMYSEEMKWAKQPGFPLCLKRAKELKAEIDRRGLKVK